MRASMFESQIRRHYLSGDGINCTWSRVKKSLSRFDVLDDTVTRKRHAVGVIRPTEQETGRINIATSRV